MTGGHGDAVRGTADPGRTHSRPPARRTDAWRRTRRPLDCATFGGSELRWRHRRWSHLVRLRRGGVIGAAVRQRRRPRNRDVGRR
jgi:hypothetical protein